MALLSDDLGVRFSAKVQAFEARVSGWPTWQKLAVFTPVVIVLLAALVALLGAVGVNLADLHHHRG
jgi:hypothetical protein